MKKGDRVTVIPEMRSRFWDIGSRVGLVIEVWNFAIVEWPGISERHHVDPAYLEVADERNL